jgi:STE24 endopeptidase
VNEDKSVRYQRLHRRARAASVCVTGATLLALYASGLSALLVRLAQAISAGTGPLVTLALYGGLVGLVLAAAGLPVAFYAGWYLERRFGLSRESRGGWLRGYAKAGAVAACVTAGFALVVYPALEQWPHTWWVVSAAAVALAMLAVAFLVPVLLLPLFFRLHPVDREDLAARLADLSRRAGLPVLGVYEWRLGDRTTRANAALAGLGRTRRILLSDTLLASHSDDEIEVIVAHELAHHANGDISTALALDAAVVTAGLAVTALVLGLGWRLLGLDAADDPAGLPLVLFTSGAVMTLARPLLNAASRRKERRADLYALALTSRPEAFISAMRRLAAQNLADTNPSPVHVLLFHTHPPIEQRIAAARAFAAGSMQPQT